MPTRDEMIAALRQQDAEFSPPSREEMIRSLKELDQAQGGSMLDSAVNFVTKTIPSYTSAPTRSAIGALQSGNNPFSAFANQFGEDPEKAPTGQQIAQRAGVSDKPVLDTTDLEHEMLQATDPLAARDLGSLRNISRSGAAGFGIEALADPLNALPVAGSVVNKLTKGAGVTGKAVQRVATGAEELAHLIDPPRLKANAGEIIEAARQMGIKVTPGMLDDSGFVERLESTLSQSPSLFGRFVNRNQRQAIEGLNRTAEGLTEGASNLSPFQQGEKFKEGISSKIAERLDPLQTVFDDVAESTRNIPISDRSKNAVKRNIENLDVFQLTEGAGKPAMYANMIPRLKNADQVKTAMTLLRNDIQQASGAEKQVLLAIKEKLSTLEKNSIMRGAIETMRGMAKNPASKEAAALADEGADIGANIVGDLRDARSGYRQLSQDLSGLGENARLKMQSGPSAFVDAVESIPSERIPDKFFNLENNRQLVSLQKNFPDEFELLKQGRLKDLLDASIDNSAMGQGKFNAAKFLKEVRKLNPEAQEKLMPGKSQVLNNIETVQRSMPRNFNPSGTASTGGWQEALYQNVRDIPTYALYRGASSNLGRNVATGLDQILKNSPEALGKFAGVLQQAETRGPQGVAATNFVLQQTNPEYRQLLQKISEQGDQHDELGSSKSSFEDR